MTEAAASGWAADRERLHALLDDSARRLAPLDDPLRVDLGLHRWLAGQREEAYSDWLAWVLERLRTPERVYQLFDLPVPAGCKTWPAPEVVRERTVPQGHEGQSGRLDIFVRWPGHAVLVIEVKVGDADIADTDKHVGYWSWIEGQPDGCQDAVLLATVGTKPEYGRFALRTWASVCVTLRRMLPELTAEVGVTTAALACAFVSAVERNLLRMPAADRVPPHALRGVADHLAGVTTNTRGSIVNADLLAAGVGSYREAQAALEAFQRDVCRTCRNALQSKATELRTVLGATLANATDRPWADGPAGQGASLGVGVSVRQFDFHGLALVDRMTLSLCWWGEERESGRAWILADAEVYSSSERKRLQGLFPDQIPEPPYFKKTDAGLELSRAFRPADAPDLSRHFTEVLTAWIDLWRQARTPTPEG